MKMLLLDIWIFCALRCGIARAIHVKHPGNETTTKPQSCFTMILPSTISTQSTSTDLNHPLYLYRLKNLHYLCRLRAFVRIDTFWRRKWRMPVSYKSRNPIFFLLLLRLFWRWKLILEMLLRNPRLTLCRPKQLCVTLRNYTQIVTNRNHKHYESSNTGPTIVLFPGQGSQFVGMAKSLVNIPDAKQLFDKASEILKYVKYIFDFQHGFKLNIAT